VEIVIYLGMGLDTTSGAMKIPLFKSKHIKKKIKNNNV